VNIRNAKASDLDALYVIGLATPEFKVSATDNFMTVGEFSDCIDKGIMIVAEDEEAILGFIYASTGDAERAPGSSWACLVYLTVVPPHRRRGIAHVLYYECMRQLQAGGVKRVYGWASTSESSGISDFLKKLGFAKGNTYTWMDREI
jgi:predicted N-acetyltransferase YhbS